MSVSEMAVSTDLCPLDRAKEHLDRLISFDTVSEKSNLPAIDYLASQLEDLGAEINLLPDATGKKANLVARFGPADQPGIVLSGHTDVVPVNEGEWTTPRLKCTNGMAGFMGGAVVT